MKHGILFAALLAASTIASADRADTAPNSEKLKGMTLVSDGLYVRKTASSASYTATNAAGRVALAEQMRKTNAFFAAQYAKDGLSRIEHEMLDRSDRTQAELRQPATQAKVYDFCTTGARIEVEVYAYDGQSAYASGVNALDFGPITPTDNYAWVRATGSTPQDDTGIGQDKAEASVSGPTPCISEAYAHVLCPAGYGGGTSDYMVSVDPYGNCQIP